jgi:hypothetical protein
MSLFDRKLKKKEVKTKMKIENDNDNDKTRNNVDSSKLCLYSTMCQLLLFAFIFFA